MLLDGKAYEKSALYFDVSSSKLKSWINGNRSPALKNIHKLANKVGCYSADLLNTGVDIENRNMHLNDLHYFL